MKFKFNNNEYELIILNVAGSRLYGNSTPASDYDYRGVFIANPTMYFSLNEKVEQLGGETGKGASGELLCQSLIDAGLNIEFTDDVVLYEIKRFFELSLGANPNILDILCHDVTSEANIYINATGQKIINNKDLFMSKKLKHTFSGYAFAQLKKMKSHKKWITEFPYTSQIIIQLKAAYKEMHIDFDFIVQNFGGPLAVEITGETAQDHYTNILNITWEDFKTKYGIDDINFDQYRLPRLYDYTKAFDLKAKQLDKDKNIINTNTTPEELLKRSGSFRSIGGSIYSIFDMVTDKPLGGVYDNNGNVKTHPPKEIGDFRFIAIFDKNEYKKHTDHINNMWNWKVKRNKSRSSLEDKFGYDTKHASHLIRLLRSAINLMQTGMFVPELSGEDLQNVIDTRAGKFTYDEIIKAAEGYENTLDIFYKSANCKLPKSPNRGAVNKLLIELINNF